MTRAVAPEDVLRDVLGEFANMLLDATFEPGFVLEPVQAADGLLAEGEMVMFETSEVAW